MANEHIESNSSNADDSSNTSQSRRVEDDDDDDADNTHDRNTSTGSISCTLYRLRHPFHVQPLRFELVEGRAKRGVH